MANYIELATSRYPVSETQIRRENPQTSYPATFPTPEGYAVVFPAPAPSYDPITQYIREIDPVLTSKGHYEQAYEVIDLDAETIAANQEAKRVAAIPSIVSMRQARLALLQAGLLTAVNTAINTAEEAVKIEWEYATEVKRDHALVKSLASALSLTETQLDELFTLAGTL